MTAVARKRLAATAAVLLAACALPAAAVSVAIELRAAFAGAPSPVRVTVGLWDAPAGGTLLYEEEHVDVPITEDTLALSIGDGTPTPAGTFSVLDGRAFIEAERYLELSIEGATVSPRVPFGAAGHAILASRVVSASGLGGDPAAALQKLVVGTCPPGASIRDVDETGAVTCELDDGVSYVAGSGLTLSGSTLSLDFSAVQAALSESCPPGTAIRSVGGDGTLACAPDVDTDTTYVAGDGLSLLGQTFAIDPRATQRRVLGECGPGLAVNAVGEDGEVLCQPVATGDVTEVRTPAGSGLTGGCASGDCTIAVDYAVAQARVPACSPGQALRAPGTCEPVGTGDIHGVLTASGSGLTSTCAVGPCTVAVANAETQRRIHGACPAGTGIRNVFQAGGVACQTLFDGDITAVLTSTTSGLTGGCSAGTCTLAADPGDAFPVPRTVYATGSVLVDTGLDPAETVRSATITAPAGFGGTVFALASGDAQCETQLCTPLEMRLATSRTTVSNTATDSRVDGPRLRTVALNGAFDVTAGQTVTVYWRAGIVNGEVRVRRPRLTVYFVPERL